MDRAYQPHPAQDHRRDSRTIQWDNRQSVVPVAGAAAPAKSPNQRGDEYQYRQFNRQSLPMPSVVPVASPIRKNVGGQKLLFQPAKQAFRYQRSNSSQGNVSSESELDMNDCIPTQVQEEIDKCYNESDSFDQLNKRPRRFSLSHLFRGRQRASSQVYKTKEMTNKEFFDKFSESSDQLQQMNESMMHLNRIAKKVDWRNDIRAARPIQSKYKDNKHYLKRQKTVNQPDYEERRKKRKQIKHMKEKVKNRIQQLKEQHPQINQQAQSAVFSRNSAQDSLEQQTEHLNQTSVVRLGPPLLVQDNDSVNVASEILKSERKLSEQEKSHQRSIRSIPEKPAYLEASLIETKKNGIVGVKNKDAINLIKKDYNSIEPGNANDDDIPIVIEHDDDDIIVDPSNKQSESVIDRENFEIDKSRDQIGAQSVASIRRTITSEMKKPSYSVKMASVSKASSKVGSVMTDQQYQVLNEESTRLETKNQTNDKIQQQKKVMDFPIKSEISLLEYHMKCYECNKQKIDERNDNIDSFKHAREKLKKKINCLKFNYSLDGIVQNMSNYEGYIQLSEDEKSIDIYLKKPKEYQVAVAQDDDMDQDEDEIFHPPPTSTTTKKSGNADDVNLVKDIENKRNLNQKNLEKKIKINIQEGVHYEYKKSSCSTKLDDVMGIIYGGISSRFWMYRKHMNYMSFTNVTNGLAAFYAWQCITLQLKSRDIDLVIPLDEDMDCFIEVLVENMNTVDGKKDSAELIYQVIEREKFRQLYHFRKEMQLNNSDEFQNLSLTKRKDLLKKAEITKYEIYQVLRTTCIKYKLQKIRSKISFSAFQRSQTIYELILMQIVKSFTDIAERKKRELDQGNDLEQINMINDETFQKIIDGSISNLFKDIMTMNRNKLCNTNDKEAIQKLEFTQAVNKVSQGKDFVEVRDKFGIIKVKEIDKQDNIEKAGLLYQMLNKTRADDIFIGVSRAANKGDEDKQVVGDKYQNLLRYKQKKDKLMEQYGKLRIIINMRAVQKFLFLRICLIKIKVAKLLLIHDLEQGQEAYIPNELSQDSLPMSFWYYDSLMNIVEGMLSHDNKRLIEFKNDFRLNFFFYDTFKIRTLRRLKLMKIVTTQLENISFRQQMVSKNELLDMDHEKSFHVKALQKSRYLVIDDRFQNLLEQDRIQQINLMDDITRSEDMANISASYSRVTKEFRSATRRIMIRYCHRDEVQVLRQRDINMKQTFLGKIEHLKLMGRNRQLLGKTHAFIEQNIDDLFEIYKQDYVVKKESKTLREIIFAEKIEADRIARAKRKLIDRLLNLVEEKQKQKLISRRINSIKQIRTKSSDRINYHDRMTYIDTHIEKHVSYFGRKKKTVKEFVKHEIEKQFGLQQTPTTKEKRRVSIMQDSQKIELKPIKEAYSQSEGNVDESYDSEQDGKENFDNQSEGAQSPVKTPDTVLNPPDNSPDLVPSPDLCEQENKIQEQFNKYEQISKQINLKYTSKKEANDKLYRQQTLALIDQAQSINPQELNELNQAIKDSEKLLQQRILKLNEDRSMMKKLMAQVMDNRGNISEEEMKQFLGKLNNDDEDSEEERQKAKRKKVQLLSREEMKEFQNVLIKTYTKNKNKLNKEGQMPTDKDGQVHKDSAKRLESLEVKKNA